MKKSGKKSKRHISKRFLYTLIIIGILLITVVGVYAFINATGGGHTSNEIILTINSCDVTLQDAINNEWLKETVAPTTCLSEAEFPDAYHLASEIILTINSYDVTMQDAIDQNYFKGTGTISSSSSSPSQGHPATEVEVTVNSVGKNLQNAIDDGDFSCVDGAGDPCGGDVCMTEGTIACGGTTCIGAEIAQAGTSCGTRSCDTADSVCRDYQDVTNYCDDLGECVPSSCSIITNIAQRGTPCGSGESKACNGIGYCEGSSGKGCTTKYDRDSGEWWYGCFPPYELLEESGIGYGTRACSTKLRENIFTARSTAAGSGTWTFWSHEYPNADPANAGILGGSWREATCQDKTCILFCWWDDVRHVYGWEIKPYGPGTV